jgi:hypothetical protein
MVVKKTANRYEWFIKTFNTGSAKPTATKSVAQKGVTPEQARRMLHDLVESIPDTELKRFVGAQITVVC